MHFSLPILTLALLATLTTLTTALPSKSILPDTTIPHSFHPPANYRPSRGPIPHHIIPSHSTRDDRSAAATIFKFENLRGPSTFIPANDYCTDMTNIFGGFDGEVRSLSTEKGVKCDFYQEPGCNVNDFTGGGMVLEVGFRGRRDVRRRLGSWAGKIASVRCQRI